MPASSRPLSALPAGFTLDAAPSDPGYAQRLGGIVGRGLIDGATGLIGTAQAAGRFVEAHTPALPGISALDRQLDGVPVQQAAANAENRSGWYAPQQASGKILEGAVGGATGAALTGGVGALPLVSSGIIGAAQPTAKALGASDQTADGIASGLALLPIAGAAAADTRNIAGNAIKNAMSRSLTKGMTPEQAGQVILYNDALKQTQAAAVGGSMNPIQAANSLKGDLANSVADYTRAARSAGYLNPNEAADVRTSLSQATSNKNALSDVPAGAFAGVRSLALPDGHGEALQGALQQLDLGSGQGFYKNSQGPLAQIAQQSARPLAFGSALLAGAHGDLLHAAELAGAGILGHGTPLAAVAGKFGQAADALLGTSLTPAEARYRGAQQIVAKSGYQVPTQQPLDALSQATAQAQREAADPFAMAQRQFVESGGMQGSPVEGPAPGGPQPAPRPAPMVQPVPQAPPQTAPQSPAGVPTGPSTASPATPVAQPAQGPSSGLQGGLPSGALALTQMVHRDYYPQQALPAFGEMADAINGLASQGAIHPLHAAAALSGQNVPRQVAGMIADRVATGRGLPSILTPSAPFQGAQEAFETAMQGTAQQATADVQQAMGGTGGGAATAPNGVPNGATNGRPPILNMARWQGASNTYQRHAATMGILAPTPGEKQAISQIAAEPSSVGKAAIRDGYLAAHPGADARRFTPQLMKGV